MSIQWMKIEVGVNQEVLEKVWQAITERRVPFGNDTFLVFAGDPLQTKAKLVKGNDPYVELTWDFKVEVTIPKLPDPDITSIQIYKDRIIANLTMGHATILFRAE